MRGGANLDFDAWGVPGQVYPANGDSPSHPGVALEWDPVGRATLIFAGVGFEDAGILYFVYSADSLGFQGMWISGSAITRPPYGYFCGSVDSTVPVP